MDKLRVAAVQFEHAAGDKAANFAKVRHFTEEARREGAHLVLFPECCLTGYFFLRHLSAGELRALAEPVPEGPLCRELLALSRESGLTVGAGLVELAPAGRMFNTFAVAMPDGRLERHRKLHAFVSPYLDSGDSFTVFDLPEGWRVGVLTCYDNNLVENARITALMGAQLILAPHQTGGCRSGDPHTMGVVDRELWERRHQDPEAVEREFRGDKGRGWLMRWLPSRAHDNGVFYLFSNGVGVDDDEIRTGGALALDPYGRVLAETFSPRDELVVTELDPALLVNNSGGRWIATRRPELYGPLTVPTGKERSTREVRFNGLGA